MNFNDFFFGDIVAIIIGFLSLFVSVIVLFITFKTWKLKSGQSVRATYEITLSTASDGSYVSRVIIENLKDKELIIFGIYLKFGANIFIDLLDIDDQYDKYHHILPPLSTRIFELGAPIYYHSGASEVVIEDLLRYDKYKGRIILLTNSGKIKAKNFKKGWSPISQSFKNYATLYIKPTRLYTKTSCPRSKNQSEHFIDYSSFEKTSKYVVNILLDSGETHEFVISDSYNYDLFKNLTFTSDVLQSKETLEEYLIKSKQNNLLTFREIIEISNIQDFIAQDKNRILTKEVVEKSDVQNKFQYYIVSQIKTWIYKLKNPVFPSKLFNIYCLLGIKHNPNKKRKNLNLKDDAAVPSVIEPDVSVEKHQSPNK